MNNENNYEQGNFRFDPMTGEKVYPTGYDPMTGEPVYEKKETVISEVLQKKNMSSNIVKIAIGAFAVVAVIVIIIKSGIFLSTPNKVLLAAKNTFEDFKPQILKDLDIEEIWDIIESEKYTIDFEMEEDGKTAEFSFLSGSSEKQLNFTIPNRSDDIEVLTSLTDSQLKVMMPDYSDDVLVYNYQEDADGYLFEMLERRGFDSDTISDTLEELYSSDEIEDKLDELYGTIVTCIRDWDWEKIDSEKFTIDGESISAKGYSVIFGTNEAESIIDALEEYIEEEFDEDFGDDLYDAFGLAKKYVSSIPDTEIRFYVYKNKLAAIELDIDDEGEISLLFEGGEFRMQNMEVKYKSKHGYSNSIKLTGKTSGDREKYKLSAAGENLIELEYDSSDGDYELVIKDGSRQESITGRINLEDDEYGLSAEYGDVECEINIRESVDFEEISGDEIVINDLDEDEFEDIINDLDF